MTRETISLPGLSKEGKSIPDIGLTAIVKCFFSIAQSLSPVRTLQMNTVVYFGITVSQDRFYTLQNFHPSV